jgi:hypothetical protein
MLWPPCVRCPRFFWERGPATSMALRRLYYGLSRVKELAKMASLPALCPQDRAVWLWPPCVRCPRSQGTRPSYLNGSTPSGTFQKKCPGYQRLLAPAYRLSLARSVRKKVLWLPETTRHRLSASLTRRV